MLIPFKGIGYDVTNSVNGQGPWVDYRKQPCADVELNWVECLEAYGIINGRAKCKKFQEDLNECKHSRIRKMRFFAMKAERYKKILRGELTWAERVGKPYAYDSFIYGTFIP